MDEQFDKKLSNHIRKVFDNYEHHGAEHGWEQLRKKFPAEEKYNRAAWLWWSSAAAVILVFVIILAWYNNNGTPVNNMAVKPIKQQQQPVIKDTAAINNTIAPDKTESSIANNNPAPVFNNNIIIPTYVDRTRGASSADNTGNNHASQNTSTIVGQQPVLNGVQSIIIAQTNPVVNNNARPVIDSQKNINNIANQPQLANNNLPVGNKVLPAAADNSTNSLANQQAPVRSMAAMFENDRLNRTTKTNKQADKQPMKKVNFSIYAATYFNYAEGSTNQVNAGAGITSDFRLSKNLKLSTGVSIAQNSLSYNTQAPQAASALADAAPALRSESLFSTTAVLPVFKNYNARLVGLDIPINIKYEFNPQKTDAYISAGLSSGTFINETYTYRYGYSGGAGFAANAAPEEQTSHNSFNSFYFAKTLNFSFGVGYPVGSNRLVIEPFVKYPLSGLGAQDIRFGAGGVNLKFSFRTQKK
ncbi:hypothetical protein NAF17_11920 [Mucilaginibacter sp. RB4R14]|uniref:hypothetical protein n=1 Tax=Mucilaginibacter aurantiaciroseus TaxID=2949308 RepID=UPI00209099A0|nr:hypothetical protein [Mucilaginibacter aurantiaciroseus]MCO5936246.1 hypothetical protein [Mucilaginibacter aurantiaciroseus]